MTVWKISPDVDLRHAKEARVNADDADRQQRTAADLLRRFNDVPGQILADEVGLGKTYTALAVAASVVLANPGCEPVVVMVPPALREKWPKEWEVFKEHYLRDASIRTGEAWDGVDFFRILDDPPDRRAQIVFLSHGAFRRQLRDSWVKLAIIKHVLKRRRNRERERRAVQKWGFDVVGDSPLQQKHPHLAAILLDTPVKRWRKVLIDHGIDPGDDPVPEAIEKATGVIDAQPLLDALSNLPANRSKHSPSKVSTVSRELNKLIGALWDALLGEATFRAPLLILDEAHHAKNRYTQLASLFANEDDGQEPGALLARFERMLFLTATPFQLGHHELIEVLRRFGAVDWTTLKTSHESFGLSLDSLEQLLTSAQAATARLDERWDRLQPDDVSGGDWWLPNGSSPNPRVAQVQRSFADANAAMRAAEKELRKWVIRHRKPDEYEDGSERRARHLGAAIADGPPSRGLDIAQGSLLPFLLAGRAQVAFARAQQRGDLPARARSLFADGLASSYEAFLDTRAGRALDEEGEAAEGAQTEEIRWYLEAISEALPRTTEGTGAHAKVSATVNRVVHLWRQGEKVVVFCHFRKTGTALRRHISSAIDAELRAAVSQYAGVPPADVHSYLENLGERIARKTDPGPLARAAQKEIREIVSQARAIDDDERRALEDILLRFLRAPVTLARYGARLASEGEKDVGAMLDVDRLGGSSLRERFERLIEFFDTRVAGERAMLIDALQRLQTGGYHADADDLAEEDPDETADSLLLPNVRLANGGVKSETRRRLMHAFNSPLLPDVLIASSVLAEGVDLHLDCRFVIHHDLDWNPSTLEQRTGRVDRLGSKAERGSDPVEIYLPYLAATQDEKMYRVVRDRERWFQVVMGARHELDEVQLERLSARVELPEAAARALAFNLTAWRAI